MSVNSITSPYTNQIFQYLQSPANKYANSTTNNEEKTNQSDVVEISSEAIETEFLNQFTEKTIDLLKIRNLTDEEISEFKNITEEAKKYNDPKSFLKSLSVDERNLVKKANSYGRDLTDSHIDLMSKEGARNMLVEPSNRHYVDLNNDGIVENGVGKLFVFPPPNSPEAVKDAWDKTLEGIPENKKLLASSVFMVQQISANIKFDGSGKAVGVYNPGDDGYTNIFPSDTNGWFSLLNDVDSYLDFSRSVANSPQQLKNIENDQMVVDLFRENIKNQN